MQKYEFAAREIFERDAAAARMRWTAALGTVRGRRQTALLGKPLGVGVQRLTTCPVPVETSTGQDIARATDLLPGPDSFSKLEIPNLPVTFAPGPAE